MRKRELKNIEWSILVIAIILCIIGLVALFSATQENEYDEFNKQCIWFVVSIIIMIGVMLIDYETMVKLSPIFYGAFIILLLAVLFTKPVNGATSWFDIGFFSFQPGEFAKIFVILFLAYSISKIQSKGKKEINKILKLLIILAIVLLPVLLIIKQPDFGTAVAFIMATAFMLISAGIDKKYIIGTILLIVVSVPLIYNFVLPEHAKSRIDIFLHPESDPRGAGYNIIQSKLAIGAGGLTGMGVLKGNQTQLRIFISKNNRLYICCNRRRNGIYYSRSSNNTLCGIHNQMSICCKNCQRRNRIINCIRNNRNICISYDRKYRNGNGVTSNYRSTTSIYKLWRKFINNKLYMYSTIVKH